MSATAHARLRVRVRGAVQGVGFRPFVHALAARLGLSGFVLNDTDGVLAEIEGEKLGHFLTALRLEPPNLARIDSVEVTSLPGQGRHGFTILPSASTGRGRARLSPDAAPCRACLDDMIDPASRFHGYPFVTCTQCGPRFSIAHRLPFDRANTSMADFPLCEDCAADYSNTTNRRFHAETISCAACGPRLSHTLAEIAAALRAGQVVALKGIGGFHLLCDATSENAVNALRSRKRRPTKPFAVMLANTASVALLADATEAELALLGHSARPIVLMRLRAGLAQAVAPALNHVGVMLPSAPLHHLLFHALVGSPEGKAWRDGPQCAALVATSGNITGQPLAITDADAMHDLKDIADMIVTHDRAVLARADDSVMAVINAAPFFIRRSRGFVPEPIDLGQDGPVVLATGGHLKTTFCITRGREAFMSQHVGDLSTPQTLRFYEDTARSMMAMLDVVPEIVACDLHPDYRSTIFAEATGLPLLRVQHHAAHLAAVAVEHHLHDRTILGVALDGHGYGSGGRAWGGEMLLLTGTHWRRHGHLLPLSVTGGDGTAREPWRMGVAALVALGRSAEASVAFPTISTAAPLAKFLDATPTKLATSSMGRLFDAAAALLGVCTHQSYEGEAAMRLEALVRAPRILSGGFRITPHVLDFRPLLGKLLEPGLSPRDGAELFHGTVISGLAAWIGGFAAQTGHAKVVLGGGCLMNRVLCEGLVAALREVGLQPFLPRAVPANDGGLSLGQAAMARAHLMAGS